MDSGQGEGHMAKSTRRGKLDPNLYWRGGVIWARIQIANREVRRSLFTSDRDEARRKLKAIKTDAERIRFGEEGRHKYEDAVVAWAEANFGGVKESSATRYRTSLRQLHEHFAPLYLDQINARTIGQYVRTRRRETGATNATIRRDLSALSRLIANSCALGWMEDNPAKAWDRSTIKQTKYVIERVDPRSYTALVEACSPTFRAYVEFCLAEGARADEAAGLRRQDVNWKTGAATLMGKTGRRTITLSARGLALLRSVPQHLTSPYIFWQPTGERYTRPSQRFVDHRSAAQRKAQHAGWTFKRFRLHDLRHEYAIRYLMHGGPHGGVGSIYKLQQHLGHSSVKTTEIYLEFLTPEQSQVAKGMTVHMADQGERITPLNPLAANGNADDA
jgi:integrase